MSFDQSMRSHQFENVRCSALVEDIFNSLSMVPGPSTIADDENITTTDFGMICYENYLLNWNQLDCPASLRAASMAYRRANSTDMDMQIGGSPVAVNKPPMITSSMKQLIIDGRDYLSIAEPPMSWPNFSVE